MLYQKVDELRKIKDLYLAPKSARSHVFGREVGLKDFLDRYLKEVLVC